MTFLKPLFFPLFISVLALLAPFFFPWPFVIGISLIAAYFVPPVSIISCGLLDMLYFSSLHGAHLFPYFTIIGIFIALLGVFVQQFVKTRIMS